MKQIQIDSEKLYKVFRERGLQTTVVAKEIGVNTGYFSNAKTRGCLSELVATALEAHYNIPRNKYIVSEKPKAEEPKEPKTRLFNAEDQVVLYECVYSAVYNAMKKVLNE